MGLRILLIGLAVKWSQVEQNVVKVRELCGEVKSLARGALTAAVYFYINLYI